MPTQFFCMQLGAKEGHEILERQNTRIGTLFEP